MEVSNVPYAYMYVFVCLFYYSYADVGCARSFLGVMSCDSSPLWRYLYILYVESLTAQMIGHQQRLRGRANYSYHTLYLVNG